MRLDLVFVSVCMALIAGSAGAVAYSAFGFGAASAKLTAIGLAEIERVEVTHARLKLEAPPAPPAVQALAPPPAAEAVPTAVTTPAPAPAVVAAPPAPNVTAADAMAATIRSAIDASR